MTIELKYARSYNCEKYRIKSQYVLLKCTRKLRLNKCHTQKVRHLYIHDLLQKINNAAHILNLKIKCTQIVQDWHTNENVLVKLFNWKDKTEITKTNVYKNKSVLNAYPRAIDYVSEIFKTTVKEDRYKYLQKRKQERKSYKFMTAWFHIKYCTRKIAHRSTDYQPSVQRCNISCHQYATIIQYTHHFGKALVKLPLRPALEHER